MTENNEANTEVNLGVVGMIDLPSFDCKPYIGKIVKIAKITEHLGKFGYYVKLETEKVADFGDKEITATKIFGLYEDKNGKVGWGINTKLGIFLLRNQVAHYKELLGRTVILITKINKDGLEFLDFN